MTLAQNDRFRAHCQRERSISAKLTRTLTNLRARMRFAVGFSLVIAAIPFAAFAWICLRFAAVAGLVAANELAPAALGLGCAIGGAAGGRALLVSLPAG